MKKKNYVNKAYELLFRLGYREILAKVIMAPLVINGTEIIPDILEKNKEIKTDYEGAGLCEKSCIYSSVYIDRDTGYIFEKSFSVYNCAFNDRTTFESFIKEVSEILNDYDEIDKFNNKCNFKKIFNEV